MFCRANINDWNTLITSQKVNIFRVKSIIEILLFRLLEQNVVSEDE